MSTRSASQLHSQRPHSSAHQRRPHSKRQPCRPCSMGQQTCKAWQADTDGMNTRSAPRFQLQGSHSSAHQRKLPSRPQPCKPRSTGQQLQTCRAQQPGDQEGKAPYRPVRRRSRPLSPSERFLRSWKDWCTPGNLPISASWGGMCCILQHSGAQRTLQPQYAVPVQQEVLMCTYVLWYTCCGDVTTYWCVPQKIPFYLTRAASCAVFFSTCMSQFSLLPPFAELAVINAHVLFRKIHSAADHQLSLLRRWGTGTTSQAAPEGQ